MHFRPLFVLSILHSYYIQGCEDFSFGFPVDTVQLLQGGRLIAKTRHGKLYILFEAKESNLALIPIFGKVLRIRLNLLNPFFSNFTNLDVGLSFPLYRNSPNPDALNMLEGFALVGQVFSHILTTDTRPVTVILKDASGQVFQSYNLTETNDRPTISYDLTGQFAGACYVEEVYANNTETIAYYSDAELHRKSAFGVIEIKIDNSFYTNPPEFKIEFTAKQEVLKYYVVSNNSSASEFDSLSVADAGEEGRSPINFVKVLPAAFTINDIPLNLLGTGDDIRVALFKSQASVPRQEKARQKIQLRKNGDVLIPHLPQPGTNKVSADLIIPLYKPKS